MAEKHFYEQIEYTSKYLLPYFEKNIPNFNSLSILEVGCAEGGLIEVLQNLGINAKGVEISQERVNIALKKNPSLKIVVGDIMDSSLPGLLGEFDFVIMREVIEHIPDKIAAFRNLEKLTKAGGYLFISFPPKYSPFAGHQQIAKSFLKIFPYLHLLPKSFLRYIAKLFKEKPDYVEEIKLHYSTGMIIKIFEKLSSDKFTPVIKELFLFRPIYAYRFRLPTIHLANIPFLREFLTFGYETLLQKKEE